MASRSPRRKSPRRRRASPRQARKRSASPRKQYWDEEEEEEEVVVPFPVYIYRPSAPVPIATPWPSAPSSPKVKELQNKLQMLLKESLEQQLAPKQDKELMLDLQLRLLHLMQQPVQNQYEIKLIQSQLEQQLKKKPTAKENMERYRQIQLLMEELDQAQKKPEEPLIKPSAVEASPALLQNILKQLDVLNKKIPAAVEAVKPAVEVVVKPAVEEVRPVEEVRLAVEKPEVKPIVVKQERKEYVSNVKPSKPGPLLSAGYKHYRDVYNGDGRGFFRALGFELLHGKVDNYKYTALWDYINNVVVKDDQFNEDETSNCVLNFMDQVLDLKNGQPGGYILHSQHFDNKVVCAMETITLAYIKQHPEYSAQAAALKKPDVAAMTLVCTVFKANVSMVSVVENDRVTVKPIIGDADRPAQVDAYIHAANPFCLLYKK